MEIRWHGLSCVSIKGENARIVVDPYDRAHAGLGMPKMEADIVLANEKSPPHYALDNVSGSFKLFDWPGEYESKGVNVAAIPAYDKPKSASEESEDDVSKEKKNVLLYSLIVDGIKVCHLSNLGHKLTNEMNEMIGDVDVLIIPVGGNGATLDAEKAHSVIEQLEPRVVIPMYYALPGCAVTLAPLNDFLKEIGQSDVQKDKVYRVKKRTDLPVDKTEFFVLEPSLA